MVERQRRAVDGPAPGERLDQALAELEGALAEGMVDGEVGAETVQRLLALATKLYARTVERSGDIAPFASGSAGLEVTSTEAAATASAILRALQIELFELGMWQMWGGLPMKGS